MTCRHCRARATYRVTEVRGDGSRRTYFTCDADVPTQIPTDPRGWVHSERI